MRCLTGAHEMLQNGKTTKMRRGLPQVPQCRNVVSEPRSTNDDLDCDITRHMGNPPSPWSSPCTTDPFKRNIVVLMINGIEWM